MFTDNLPSSSALKDRKLRMPVPSTFDDSRGTPALQVRNRKKIVIVKQTNMNLPC